MDRDPCYITTFATRSNVNGTPKEILLLLRDWTILSYCERNDTGKLQMPT